MPGGILLCTSNGVGLGHLTRVMAVGNEMDPADPPVIFTLSGAVSIPVQQGFHVEHLPSSEYRVTARQGWHRLLAARMRLILETYEPSVVVFDGVHPYAGFVDELTLHRRRITRVWQRRGMWKPGVGDSIVLHRPMFDHIVEPGDFAAADDVGVTTRYRHEVHGVAPIVYCGRSDHPYPAGREALCADLGIDPARRNVLVQLGAGQINDLGSLTSRLVRSLGRMGDVDIVVAQSTLSVKGDLPSHVTLVNRFPINRWFGAFDAGVFAAGYNSFHEALAAGLPTLFVPNMVTKTDDQGARSNWAHRQGIAISWEDGDDHELDATVDRLMSAEFREQSIAGMAALPAADGAADVARFLQELRR